jgi:hypothetical protein
MTSGFIFFLLVMVELSILAQMNPGRKSGPIITCETTGKPWLASEYRRKWRLIANRAGVPNDVRNLDTQRGTVPAKVRALVS